MGAVTIIASFFYFPFYFTFFPFANTKMILALGGLIWLLINMSTNGQGKISRDFFIASLFALGVSLASYVAMVYNQTFDDSYLSYIVSMWVWCGAAYFFVHCVRGVHGMVSVGLICQYLIAVGTLQCLIAIAIDKVIFIKNMVSLFLLGTGFMGITPGRLHGIGCALDVGGGRLAIVLLMIGILIPRVFMRHDPKRLLYLFLAFGVVSIIGNMIGRTAILGVGCVVGYWLFLLVIDNTILRRRKKKFVCLILVVVATIALMSTALYHLSPAWKKNFRFGFEGFFSLVEKGKWETQSTSMLKQGFIYPDNPKTWIIGDGYMANPEQDPYYQGPSSWGFYMNTDAGYSRFIFYFGVFGLMMFALFMIQICLICVRRFPQYKMMFLGILLLNFLIWIKVSTDVFLAFTPFLCCSREEQDSYEKNIQRKAEESVVD